jgi:hypothetical protein
MTFRIESTEKLCSFSKYNWIRMNVYVTGH